MNTVSSPSQFDVICVGMACYDQIFCIDNHPDADSKVVANAYLGSGGGPAANAAVTVSRLGLKAAFIGYLGNDIYGDQHWQELAAEGVDTSLVKRGSNPTPLASILVKPNGDRALISFKGDTRPLSNAALPNKLIACRCMLFDGHEPEISPQLADYCHQQNIPTVLDAGSVHTGTLALLDKVDYLVCSEKFAQQLTGQDQPDIKVISEKAKAVVITLGARGLVWQIGQETGALPAYSVNAIDTTGAGDAFHGAFAAAIAQDMDWDATIRYASAAGAICCTKTGARFGIPYQKEIDSFFRRAD